jgi:V/A-type H+-transporting ATPase subunit E
MSETSRFTEDISTAANDKARTIIDEAESETQQALAQAKIRSVREAEDILNSGRAEAEAVRRRQISEIRQRLKLQEQFEKSKIVTEVLDQSKERMMDILRDEKRYLPYLTALTASGIREIGLDAVIVHLNSHDLNRVNAIEFEREVTKLLGRSVKIELSREPMQALGGVVVSSKDGKARIINTLDQRFEALEPKLLIEAGKILFGE